MAGLIVNQHWNVKTCPAHGFELLTTGVNFKPSIWVAVKALGRGEFVCPFLLGPALASKVVWWLLFFFLVQISSTFRQTSHIQIDGGEGRFESEKGLDPIYLYKWKKCCSRFAIKLRPWEEGPLLKSFFFFFGFQCLSWGWWCPIWCFLWSWYFFLPKDTCVLGWVSSGLGAKRVCSALRPLGCSVRTSWPLPISLRFVSGRGRPCWSCFDDRQNSAAASSIDFPSGNWIF